MFEFPAKVLPGEGGLPLSANLPFSQILVENSQPRTSLKVQPSILVFLNHQIHNQTQPISYQVHRRRLRVRVDELRQRPARIARPLGGGRGGHLGAEVGHPIDVAGGSAGVPLVPVPPAVIRSVHIRAVQSLSS